MPFPTAPQSQLCGKRSGAIATNSVTFMRRAKRLLVAALTVGLALMSLTAPTSASATQIGSGRALIRIDAATATVSKNSDGTFTLKIPTGSKGQFLGERTDASGSERIRVGNLSAKQLSSKWKDFQYSSAGTKATIAWNSSDESWSGALVRFYKPTVTKSAINFKFTSSKSLPNTLNDVSVNLQRAPNKQVRTTYNPQAKVHITGDMYFFAGYYSGSKVDVNLMDVNANCWSHTFNSYGVQGIPDESCAGIAQSSGTVSWNLQPSSSSAGASGVYVETTLQPGNEPQFTFQQVIIVINSK